MPSVLICRSTFPQIEGINRRQGRIEAIKIDNHIPRKGRQFPTIFGTEVDLGIPVDTRQNGQSVGSANHGPGLINKADMIFQQGTWSIGACVFGMRSRNFKQLQWGQNLD